MLIFMYERVLLPGLLPKTGSIATLKLCDKIREKLRVVTNDKARCDVRVEDGKIKWNKIKDRGIEIKWDIKEAEMISNSMIKASLDETIPNVKGFLDFYIAFGKEFDKKLKVIK